MKTNKKAYIIMAIGLLLANSNFILFRHIFTLSDPWAGLLQGAGIGIMIGAVIKMRKERKHAPC